MDSLKSRVQTIVALAAAMSAASAPASVAGSAFSSPRSSSREPRVYPRMKTSSKKSIREWNESLNRRKMRPSPPEVSEADLALEKEILKETLCPPKNP